MLRCGNALENAGNALSPQPRNVFFLSLTTPLVKRPHRDATTMPLWELARFLNLAYGARWGAPC